MDSCTPPIVDGVTLQLVQVHVIFRHGERSPISFANASSEITDRWGKRLQELPDLLPQREYCTQEYPFGQLTKTGALQAVNVGSWLKQYYMNLGHIGLESPTSSIQIRSTSYRRTHFTGWFVLEGLLGSSQEAATVPIVLRDEKDETIYRSEKYCPSLARVWRTVLKNLLERKFQPDGTLQKIEWLQDFKKSMSDYMGLELNSNKKFPWLLAMDMAQCGKFYGDNRPYGVTDEQLEEMREWVAEEYLNLLQDPLICQLVIGGLMQEITEELLLTANEHSLDHPSLLLYAGHDATIFQLSVCLGVPWKGWPAYLAHISIELWRTPDKMQHYIRVNYDKKDVALPINLTTLKDVLSCKDRRDVTYKTLCTLDEFHTLAKLSTISKEEFLERCHDERICAA